MDSEQRLTSLEQALTRMLEKEADTQQKLDTLISRLPTTSEPTFPILPKFRDVPPKPQDPSKPRKVRPASPLDFDGDRSKGLAFLNSCQVYIRLCPEEFRDEQTQIVWAMSYMKTGRAEKLAAQVFRWEQELENQGKAKFVDWEDFRNEFRREFCPSHTDSTAIN